MVTLGQRRLAAAQEAVRACSDVADVEQFRRRLMESSRTLVACDAVAYNEVSLVGEPAITRIDPEELGGPDADAALMRNAHEHPLITHYARTGDDGTSRLSDFLSLRELRGTALYAELFQPMGVTRQVAMALPSTPQVAIAVTVNRSGRDFDDGDRAVLDAVRPRLAQAFRHAVAVTGVLAAVERLDDGVVVVDTSGRIAHLSGPAERKLRRWSLHDQGDPARLPDVLVRWLSSVRRAPAGGTGACYEVRSGSAGLEVRWLASVAGQEVLRLTERRHGLAVEDLRALGLTVRQSEVLLALCRGSSNAEIAAELSTTVGTVRKHVEHLFARLGVGTRAEAVALAYREATRPR